MKSWLRHKNTYLENYFWIKLNFLILIKIFPINDGYLVSMALKSKDIHHHLHHTQCIPFIENYGQGLGREGRRQLIPIKESAAKESPDSRKNKISFCN